MQVCTSLQTDNHANTPPLSFLQVGCPSCRPTNSVKALKAVAQQCMKEIRQLDKVAQKDWLCRWSRQPASETCQTNGRNPCRAASRSRNDPTLCRRSADNYLQPRYYRLFVTRGLSDVPHYCSTLLFQRERPLLPKCTILHSLASAFKLNTWLLRYRR